MPDRGFEFALHESSAGPLAAFIHSGSGPGPGKLTRVPPNVRGSPARSALDESAYRRDGVVRLTPADAERRATASLAEQVDRRALRGSTIRADDGAVYVEVSGSVDVSLLQLLSPGDAFEITVRAVARPQAAP